MRVGRCTHEIFAVVGHRHQKLEWALNAGWVCSQMCERALAGSWNKCMTILPVQWPLLHSLRYMESYSWCGGGKTCAWSLIAVCMLVQICQVGIGSKLVIESKNGVLSMNDFFFLKISTNINNNLQYKMYTCSINIITIFIPLFPSHILLSAIISSTPLTFLNDQFPHQVSAPPRRDCTGRE